MRPSDPSWRRRSPKDRSKDESRRHGTPTPVPSRSGNARSKPGSSKSGSSKAKPYLEGESFRPDLHLDRLKKEAVEGTVKLVKTMLREIQAPSVRREDYDTYDGFVRAGLSQVSADVMPEFSLRLLQTTKPLLAAAKDAVTRSLSLSEGDSKALQSVFWMGDPGDCGSRDQRDSVFNALDELSEERREDMANRVILVGQQIDSMFALDDLARAFQSYENMVNMKTVVNVGSVLSGEEQRNYLLRVLDGGQEMPQNKDGLDEVCTRLGVSKKQLLGAATDDRDKALLKLDPIPATAETWTTQSSSVPGCGEFGHVGGGAYDLVIDESRNLAEEDEIQDFLDHMLDHHDKAVKDGRNWEKRFAMQKGIRSTAFMISNFKAIAQQMSGSRQTDNGSTNDPTILPHDYLQSDVYSHTRQRLVRALSCVAANLRAFYGTAGHKEENSKMSEKERKEHMLYHSLGELHTKLETALADKRGKTEFSEWRKWMKEEEERRMETLGNSITRLALTAPERNAIMEVSEN